VTFVELRRVTVAVTAWPARLAIVNFPVNGILSIWDEQELAVALTDPVADFEAWAAAPGNSSAITQRVVAIAFVTGIASLHLCDTVSKASEGEPVDPRK
jgi:hypothetical protein